jgi:outer membrane murein-binding lipoprotein Lpp
MAEAADEIVALREAMDDLEQEMRHLENLVQAAKDDGWSGGYSG